MSSYTSRTDVSSPGLYVPIHRRTASSSSSRTPSPLSSRAVSPSTSTPRYVYTPADLLSLSRSPLVAQLSTGDMDARLRAIAPEVVQTRKQRKALAWHARRPTTTPTPTTGSRSRPRCGSHTPQTSESEEDRTRTWRRV